MPTLDIDIDQLRAQATALMQRVAANPDFDLIIVGSLLVAVVLLTLVTIWRARSRAAAAAIPASTPSSASGFRRWLTPMGMQSIPAEQAVVTRPARRSGSNKTIRVSTPVSKVPARALKAAGADAREIARRSGLSRDAVVMMMAAADPKARARRTAAGNAAPTLQPPTRSVSTERAMTAPGAYGSAPRSEPSQAARPVGSRFNVRVG